MPCVLKKQNGQAFIEAMALTPIIALGTFFLLAVFFNQLVSIAIDDAIETYFFCQIQKQKNCMSELNQNLKLLRLSRIQLREKNNPPLYEIMLSADTSYKYEIRRKRKMVFDRNLQIF